LGWVTLWLDQANVEVAGDYLHAFAHHALTAIPPKTTQGDAAAAPRDQAAEERAAADAEAEAEVAAPAQPSRAAGVKISAKKLEFIKTMLLKKLQEETDHQEAAAIERRQQREAEGGDMDVDDAAGARGGEGADAGDQGVDKPGMKQQDLVDWYMEMQINRCGAVLWGGVVLWEGGRLVPGAKR